MATSPIASLPAAAQVCAALRLVMVAAACVVPVAALAQVYVGHGESGSIILSNHASVDARELLIADESALSAAALKGTAAAAPPAGVGRAEPPAPIAASIRRVALRHSLPEALLTALIAVESGFDPRAVSPKGAQGLMQLMPDTARRFGVKDVFAIDDNLEGGATYLRWLLNYFGEDVNLALAAYNAGEHAVERAGRRVPAYRETQDYVRKVIALASRREPPHQGIAAR